MNKYYHGSSSASIPGVFHKESPGLKPTGVLLEQGRVPYSGELSIGISSKGVNRHSISVVLPNSIRGAVDYALRYGSEGWDPQKSKKIIEFKEKKLINKVVIKDSAIADFLRMERESLETQISIEQMRLNGWQKLQRWEKKLIQDSFAVLYGIDYDGETEPVASRYHSEVGIPASLDLRDITIYVTENQVSRITSLANQISVKASIKSFSDLEELKSFSIDNEIDINRLLNKKESSRDILLRILRREGIEFKT